MRQRHRRSIILIIILDSSCVISELFTIVIFVEGEGCAAGHNPDDRDHHSHRQKGIARRLQFISLVLVTNLEACRVIAVNWHQNHQCGLKKGGNYHSEDNAEDLYPEFVVF